MGRVYSTAKAEPAKAQPAINWSGIESRLQEISMPARAGDSPVEMSLPVEASAPLAHDPAFFDEPPATMDQPVSIPGDPRDMLSMPAAMPSNRSSKKLLHQFDCREAS